MTDPLTSINAEELEKNVNEAYKTMHKSVKIFNDIPSTFSYRLIKCTCLSFNLKVLFSLGTSPVFRVCHKIIKSFFILAHWISISDILSWVRNFYLTHVIVLSKPHDA